jgi:hypothetical protein
MTEVAFDPDESEVVQSEQPEHNAVAVVVETPVRTHSLPNKWGSHGSVDLAAAGVYNFHENPNRSVLTLIAKTNPMLVSTSRAGLQTGAEWPVGIPLVITHREEVWLTPQTDTAKISWIEESWN